MKLVQDTPVQGNTRDKRVLEICELALEVASAERAALLRTHCDGDEELLKNVEAMLRLIDRTDHPSSQQTGNRDPLNLIGSGCSSIQVGDEIGDFLLEERIGTGGMGAVFRAVRTDSKNAQQVAIKVLNAQIITAELRLRFDIERDILSRLRHPYIAGLIDGGTTSNGVPYLAMELVDGQPIDEFCDTNRLRVADRIALLEKVAHALQHAHQNLIVHRDIKPTNILVTKDSIPKLVDFGIAKLVAGQLDSTESDSTNQPASPHGATTYFGNQALTPDFASPEQLLEGKVSTASDQYSLGILATVLLTGRRPYQLDFTSPKAVFESFSTTGSWRASGLISQARSQPDLSTIAQSRRTTPAKIKKRFRGDLDTVLAKATHIEPERRYPSMAAFAQDFANHRQRKPVIARGDSIAYRTWSLVRTNKLAFSVVSATLVALSIGLTAALWQAEIARDRFADLHQFSGVVIGDIYNSVAELPGSTPTRQLIAKEAQHYLDKLAGEQLSDETLLADLSLAYRRIADVQGRPSSANLGQSDKALANYVKAQQIAEQIPNETPSMRRARAQIYRRKGELMAWQGDVDSAISELLRALSMLQELHESEPSSHVARVDYAYNLINLGDRFGHPSYQNIGDPAGARDYYNQAIQTLAQPAENSTDEELRRAYSVSLERAGTMTLQTNELALAQSYFEQSRAIRVQLATDHPEHMNIQRDAGIAMEQIAKVRLRQNDIQGAINDFQQALAVYIQLYRIDPEDASAKRTVAIGRENLGDALAQNDEFSAAQAEFSRAEGLFRELLAKDPGAPRLIEKLAQVQAKIGPGAPDPI